MEVLKWIGRCTAWIIWVMAAIETLRRVADIFLWHAAAEHHWMLWLGPFALLLSIGMGFGSAAAGDYFLLGSWFSIVVAWFFIRLGVWLYGKCAKVPRPRNDNGDDKRGNGT